MRRHSVSSVPRRRLRTIALLITGALAVGGVLATTVLPASGAVSAPPCTGSSFQIGISRTDDTATPGTTASTRVHLISHGTFNCHVALSASGLPAGVTATFDSGILTVGSAPSQLVLTTSTTSPLGRFPIKITGIRTDPNGGAPTAAVFQLVIAAVDAPGANGDNGRYTMLARNTTGSTMIGAGSFDHTSPTFTLVRRPNFHDSVRMVASDLPAGVTASVSNGTEISEVTLTPSAPSPVGTFRITLTATSIPSLGTQVFTATLHFWLTIYTPPGFSLSLSQGAGSAAQGAQVTTQVRQSALGGLSDVASIAVGALPAGVTATLSAAFVSSTAPVTLTLQTSATSPTGTFFITVGAASVATGLPETVVYQLTIT